MKRLTDNYHFYAIITICMWAPTYVMTGLLAAYFSPAALGFLRYLIASFILGIIVITNRIRIPDKQDLPLFLAAGICGFALYMVVFNHGTGMVSAATSSIILALAPVLTDLFAAIFFKEKLKNIQWLAVGIEFLGIIVLTLLNSTFSVNIGVLWVSFAAMLLSLYNILQRKLSRKYSSLQTSAFSIFMGTLILSLSAPTAFRQINSAPTLMVIYVVILGIFSSAIAYATWTTALAKAQKTSDVMIYMFVTPFLASALGFVLAGQIPDLQIIIGGVIILAGAILFVRNK